MTRATKPLRHQKKASSKRSAWRQLPSDMSEQAARRSAAGCEIEGVTFFGTLRTVVHEAARPWLVG